MKLSVGGILSGTFGMARERLGSLVGMWFVYFAVQIAVMIVMFIVMGATVGLAGGFTNPAALEGAGLAGFGVGMVLFMIVFYLVYILVGCAQAASLNVIASPLQQVSFSDAFSAGLRSALPLLGVIVLFLIAYFIGAFVIGMVVGLLSSASSALGIVASIAVLVGVLYLASRLAIIFPTVAVEKVRNPITAITRSWSLTRGNALPIFLTTLIVVVLAGVLVVIAFLPVIGSFRAMAGGNIGPDAAAPAIGGILFMLVGFFVVSVLISIVSAAFQSSIHAQLSGSTGEDLSETFQ